MEVVALVLGAGRGARLAAPVPKARVRVAGRTLIDWSAASLARARGVDAVLPVVAPGDEPVVEQELRASWVGPAQLLQAVPGGASRQDSLGAGLAGLARQAPGAAWVLVHDAARCLVRPQDAEAVLAAARPVGAAVPVVPIADTIKEIDGERVIATPDRDRLARAQTPQAFRLALLCEALDKARREGFTGTDCASLVERLGLFVRACPGRAGNFKVTLPEDLERAEALLQRGGGAS